MCLADGVDVQSHTRDGADIGSKIISQNTGLPSGNADVKRPQFRAVEVSL